MENTRVSHHRFTGKSGPPCAMVLTVSFVLSLVTGLSCHHSPVRCESIVTDLNASVGASGPHDFAVRNERASSLAPIASTASHRNVRDDREPPLIRGETGAVKAVIWVKREAEYFCAEG
jgi:hypothetical protein